MRMARVASAALLSALAAAPACSGVLDVSQEAPGTETRITRPGGKLRVDLSGDRIVWAEAVLGGVEGSQSDIFTFDLRTRVEEQVTMDEANQAFPDVSGDRIVWEESPDGTNREIVAFDLVTGERIPITGEASDRPFGPAIDGDRVVWADHGRGGGIFQFDFGTREVSRVTEQLSPPALSGDRVVWADGRNGNLDIFLLDLATGEERRLTTNEANQQDPRIAGDHVVWVDERSGNPDVFLYDLVTGEERRLTSDDARQINPDVSSELVVWEDWREEGGRVIGVYETATGEVWRIPNVTSPFLAPFDLAVSGRRVAWIDTRVGNSEVIVFDVAP